jgi:CheY-like chemotaxis protein
LLGDLGAEFNECADGSQALSAYREHCSDLVLMDINMKEIDGIEATRQLRAAFPEARVIIVTEIANPLCSLAAEKAGASAYVLKENLLTLPAILRQMSGEPDSSAKLPVDEVPKTLRVNT